MTDTNYRINPAQGKNPESITCLRCNMTSYYPEDVYNKYCGSCHIFHNDQRDDNQHDEKN